jgi:anti-sigma factor RsiW
MDRTQTPPDRTACDAWLERLSEYLDGELSPGERRPVEQHLSECPTCAFALEELQRVASRAKAWNQPSEPATDLWPGIAARLEPRRPAWWRLPALVPLRWSTPRLAAAAIVVFVLAIVTGVLVRPQPPAHQAVARPSPGPARPGVLAPADHDGNYEATVAGLHREAAARLTHDPHVVEVLDENLASLDAAIANYRAALRGDPADPVLRRRLEEARRRKIDVLRSAVALSTEGSE